nr:MAG TPA: major capsid protein [Caudoviricetes sp.]
MNRKDQIMQRQQEIINAARSGRRELTVEEQAEFDELQRELGTLDSNSGQQPEGQRSAENTGGGNPSGDTPEQAAQRAIETERQRVAEITSLCRSFDLSPDEYISSGKDIEAVRTAVIEQLQRTSAPIGMRVTADEGDKFRERATDALMMRSGAKVERPSDGSVQMRGMSLRDLAVECLAREGQDSLALLRMDPTDMYNNLCRQFYNPTAAFPAILDNTIKKSIVQLYEQVPTTFQAWTTKGSLKDFKETKDHEYAIGGTGDFLKVGENGELKADKPNSALLPSRKLDTYGRSFSMTRQAFINDDIGFLTEIPGLYATRAKKTIDKQVYTLLFNNSKIYDGVELFHSKHKNLLTEGSKPTQAAIQKMILQMQKQTDQFGEAIYITPQHIIVPVGYEFDLAVILHSAQVTGSGNNDVNPLFNYPINIVQTPVLNALAGENAAPWFTVANPTSAKSIQVDYLNGQETPTVRRMEAPGVLGFTWDIYHDWGIAVRDFRGMAKNPGEVIG